MPGGIYILERLVIIRNPIAKKERLHLSYLE